MFNSVCGTVVTCSSNQLVWSFVDGKSTHVSIQTQWMRSTMSNSWKESTTKNHVQFSTRVLFIWLFGAFSRDFLALRPVDENQSRAESMQDNQRLEYCLRAHKASKRNGDLESSLGSRCSCSIWSRFRWSAEKLTFIGEHFRICI